MRVPRKPFTFTSIVVGVAIVALFLWPRLYPEPYDPKNLGYVLWAYGLNQHMDSDAAVAGMTHDTRSVRIVKGMTKEELKTRFGYIRSFDEARPYLQLCASAKAIGQLGVSPEGKEVAFLRDSAWMVIFENGRAADLVLCKGY